MKESLHLGDNLGIMRGMEAASVDSIVTDPPYGLEFMGKDWDAPWKDDPNIGKTWHQGMCKVEMPDGATRLDRPSFEKKANVKCRKCEKWKLSSNPCKCASPDFPNLTLQNMRAFQSWCEEWSRECLRVLKPGGYMLAFSSTRTYHRLASAVEDAGFEIRDQIGWCYGNGFPKSLDVSDAVQRWQNGERFESPQVAIKPGAQEETEFLGTLNKDPETESAGAWGTALKPAWEPIVVARKPLIGTVAQNILTHGTGALNIHGCRVGEEKMEAVTRGVSKLGTFEGADGNTTNVRFGRWPSNVVHDGSSEVLAHFPSELDGLPGARGPNDKGSAARFFYCPKAQKNDREEGLWDFTRKKGSKVTGRKEGSTGAVASAFAGTTETARANIHPTVKPTALMRWLLRLVTPPGGRSLDPFMGSGSTGKAAVLEGFEFWGIEREPEYLEISKARVAFAHKLKAEAESQQTLF